jgi:hypothetical protein
MSATRRAIEPTVPCPAEFQSPFLEAAGSLGSEYDSLSQILCKIEGLISQGSLGGLQQAGEELIQEAKSRASRQPEDYRLGDACFSFTTNRQSYQYYGQAHRETKWHTVPFLGNVTAEDLSIYLAITGKNKQPVPLSVARALVDGFRWTFLLSEIGNNGVIPEIPETIVIPPELQIDHERRLVIFQGHSDSVVELDVNWRMRGQAICKAVQECKDDRFWLKESVAANLVRAGDKYIWLSTEAPSKAALLCPRLIQIRDHFEEIKGCLKLWRINPGKSDDSSARLKRWLESKPGAVPWIAHISEMILSKCSPWPEPFQLRPESDSERDWSPEQCLKQVMPLFRTLARAPLRTTPPNLVKSFLYLIRRPIVDAVAYAGEFSGMWNFSVRTYDHSWINGEIVGDSTLGSNSPFKFKGIGYEGAGDYCISCDGIDCFISEEKNKRY